MAYPIEVKRQFAKSAQILSAQLGQLSVQYTKLRDVYARRTWGTGGADAITDADLNPDNPEVGPNLGITAVQLNAMLNFAWTQFNALMTGGDPTAYNINSAINDIRSDI